MSDDPRDDSDDEHEREGPRAAISAELVAVPDEPEAESDAEPADSRGTPELPRGSVVGRYTVLGRLAESEVDVIYGAYDPDTEGKVAIRLIRVMQAASDADLAAARTRMLEEARALARIDHPCIARVHEVGVLEGRIYLVMEFLDGIDLRKWMEARDDPFPWREVLRVFREAGRGLAVAHKAGILHRDFSPRTVLLCKGGRICLLDFGLGRREAPGVDDDVDVSELKVSFPGEVVSRSDQPSSVTTAGLTLGTPHYMAPEVHITQRADAKSDQFSFCVALYEALYGERPFGGSRPIAIAMEAVRHNVRKPPEGSNVPEWLRKVVLRGLRARAEERWPSMDALMRELARDPAASRRRWAVGGLVLAGVIGGGVGIARQLEAERRSCAPEEDRLAGIWDPPRRARLAAAVLGSGRPWAAETWATVQDGVDRWTNEWIELEEAACVATRIRGEASEELYALRLDCLQRQLLQLDALGELLESGDPIIVDGAHGLVTQLRSARECTFNDDLTGRPAIPEDRRDKIEALQRDLVRAESLRRAGGHASIVTTAESLVSAAEDLRYSPLQADALLLVGRVKAATGDLAAAEDAMHRAAAVATRAGLEPTIVQAWTALAPVAAARGRPDEGRRWAEYAGAIVDRRQYTALQPAVATAHADIAVADGRLAEALAQYYRAIELEDDREDAHPLRRVPIWRKLGRLHAARGDHEAAIRRFEDSLATLQEALGPRHPVIADVLGELAESQREGGELEDAIATLLRAVELRQQTAPAIETADLLVRTAEIETQADREDDALARYVRVIADLETAGPAGEGLLARALLGRGLLLLDRGDAAAAIDPLTRAVNLREADGDTSALADARFALARALWVEPKLHATALDLARTARHAYETANDPNLAAVQRWLDEHDRPAVR